MYQLSVLRGEVIAVKSEIMDNRGLELALRVNLQG